MNIEDTKTKLIHIVADAAAYCYNVENCLDDDKQDFIDKIALNLSQLYLDFISVGADELVSEDEMAYLQEYVDEDMYEEVKRKVWRILGEDDTYLETFEEDMKYSDTPIAASISESLADIFQPLYNFISVVKETSGENIEIAYKECKDKFDEYWSQTLCNVMRPINYLRINPKDEDD